MTVLGVVFFFVLAVEPRLDRPGRARRARRARVAARLRRPASSFTGATAPPTRPTARWARALAGGYATLLAAAALYDLVSDLQALAIAAGIGAVGLATSLLYWGSELIAGIGLVGATLVPMMVLFEEDISTLGTALRRDRVRRDGDRRLSCGGGRSLLGVGFLAASRRSRSSSPKAT